MRRRAPAGRPSRAAPPADAKRVDASKAGTVTGRVVLDGAVPENPTVKLSGDPYCERVHPNGARFEHFVVDNGGLENVFVYVKDGLSGYYFEAPTEVVKLDQVGCLYVPHVTGLRVKQPLVISNSDDTLHTVHAMGQANPAFNLSQAMQKITQHEDLQRPGGDGPLQVRGAQLDVARTSACSITRTLP